MPPARGGPAIVLAAVVGVTLTGEEVPVSPIQTVRLPM
jgi:hypothetical protein